MYALALALGGASALPYFHLGSLDVGIPIQSFGVIVAVGVLLGAGILRRYAEWHGISDDHIRGITGWVRPNSVQPGQSPRLFTVGTMAALAGQAAAPVD